MFWAKVVCALCLQDPDTPVEKPLPPMKIAPAPAPGRPMPIKPQSGSCDQSCHEKLGPCPDMAMICRQCRREVTPCATHAQACLSCADKAQVCAYCLKARAGSRAAAVKKVEEELAKALPDHKIGRVLPNESAGKLLPHVRFFMVLHAGSPCKTCGPHQEPLAAVEFKDEKDSEGQVRLLKSEKDLAELLARQKLPADEEGCLLAAQLVQAMWEPLQGGLTPDLKDKVSIEAGEAVFEFKKGKDAYRLRVATADGKLKDLFVEKK